MEEELHRATKGKLAELRVAARLLEDGDDLYAPLVDIRGIDFLLRRHNGEVHELQVKSSSHTTDSPDLPGGFNQLKELHTLCRISSLFLTPAFS